MRLGETAIGVKAPCPEETTGPEPAALARAPSERQARLTSALQSDQFDKRAETDARRAMVEID
jgi:hypothetical protein